MSIRIIFRMVLAAYLLVACGGRDNRQVMSDEEMESTRNALVGANRILVTKDRERIRSFIGRKGWEMTESESGLWYHIYAKGNGTGAVKGMLISLEYTVSLLDGTLCYSSDSLGIKQFRIGQGGVESGLEEGVLLLQAGDRARFVMPPHLAHGLTGDGDRIPARAIIVYDIHVVGVDNLQEDLPAGSGMVSGGLPKDYSAGQGMAGGRMLQSSPAGSGRVNGIRQQCGRWT